MNSDRTAVRDEVREPHPVARLSASLLPLLRDAGDLMEGDVAAARACLGLVIELLTVAPPVDAARGPGVCSYILAPWQARRIAAHIEANLAASMPIASLAQITRLSSTYFSRAFKGSFGMSPHAYVVERRIQMAEQMLLQTDQPLCDIALACGMSDQAHFSRLFSRKNGIPPGVWRRERRGGRRLF